MSKGKIVDVEKVFFKLLDENTPYYQDVFRLLSAEKRKIFDTLIEIGKPATPKEIAKRARMDDKIVNTQLRRLEKDGYVISRRMGRTAKYEVRERLFRLWRELRRQPFAMKKLSILIEFLELWYSPEERKKKFLEDLERLRETLDGTRVREASYWFLSLPKEYKRELIPQIVEEIYKTGAVNLLDEFLVYEDRELKEESIEAEFRTLLFRERKYEEALKKAEEMIKLDKSKPLSWFSKGLALGNLGRNEEALAAFSKAIELDPEFSLAWCGKGLALRDLGRHEEALAAFSKAIELDPEFGLAWYGKGTALRDLGRYEEALAAFSKAIELDPEFGLAWYSKGLALRDLGRHEEALAAFSKAVELDPEFSLAWYDKGLALRDLGRYEEALAAFSKAVELDPEFSPAWYDKGLALRDLGRYEEALAAFSKAVELAPEFGLAWYGKGLALGNLGRYEEAWGAFSKAVELAPEQAHLWYLKGAVHLMISLREFNKNNYGNALENLNSALEAFNAFSTHSKSEESKERVSEGLMAFMMGLIDTKNVKAVEMALLALFEKNKELRELFEPIHIAVEIVKSKDMNRYYELQVEIRELVAEIVKKLTGSEELLPEEYRSR